MVLYMSAKHVADDVAFEQAWISKFEELLNQSGRAKGKGKGKGSITTPMEIENASMPYNATWHAKWAKVPFAISFRVSEGQLGGLARELWQNAVAQTHALTNARILSRTRTRLEFFLPVKPGKVLARTTR